MGCVGGCDADLREVLGLRMQPPSQPGNISFRHLQCTCLIVQKNIIIFIVKLVAFARYFRIMFSCKAVEILNVFSDV